MPPPPLKHYRVPIKLHQQRGKTKACIAYVLPREGATFTRVPQEGARLIEIRATTLEAAYRELYQRVRPLDRRRIAGQTLSHRLSSSLEGVPMVQIVTVPSTGLDYANLQASHYMPPPEPRHTYRAMLVGLGIVVEDAEGQPVAVEFGATEDLRTVYAQVQGVGFIGGWQYPHRAMPWSYLVDSINAGRLYTRLEDLPNRWQRLHCPHCGGSLV